MIIDFPVSNMQAIAETADCELTEWCLEKIEQGLDPVYLVGILQYQMQYILTDMIEEE